MKTFKNIIKELRQEQNFTQIDLSKALGISKSTIAMWETGKRLPSTEMFEMVADYFNVDLDYLYGKQDMKCKISLEDLEKQTNLLANYTISKDLEPYLTKLKDMPINYRQLCFQFIDNIYSEYENLNIIKKTD